MSSIDVHLPTKESMRNSGTSELRSPTTSSDFLDIGGSVYVAEVNHTDIGQACADAIGPPQITGHILVVPDQVFGFALHPHDRHRQRPDDPSQMQHSGVGALVDDVGRSRQCKKCPSPDFSKYEASSLICGVCQHSLASRRGFARGQQSRYRVSVYRRDVSFGLQATGKPSSQSCFEGERPGSW